MWSEEVTKDQDIEKAIESIDNGEKPHGTEMVMTLQTGEKRTCNVPIDRLNRDEFVLSINDITDRMLAGETLLGIQQRFRSLFEHMLNGIAYCRMLLDDQGHPVDFVYLDVNSAFESLTGLKDVVGKRVTDVIPGIKESSPELFEIYGRVAMTGKSETFETNIERLNIWLNISVYSPEKRHFIAVFENITERKHAEDTLRESERKYRLLAENVNDVIWTLNIESQRFTYASPSVEKLSGFTVEETLHQTLKDILHPDSYAGIMRQLPILIEKYLHGSEAGKAQRLVARQRRKDGTWMDVEVVASLLQDIKGEFTEILGVTRDVTERKQNEAALRESEERYRAFFATSQDCAFITTLDGKWVDFNDAAVEMFGYDSREELLKTDISHLYANSRDRDEHTRYIRENGCSFDYPIDLRKKDGTIINTLITSVARKDTTGSIISFQGSIRNITDLKRAEEALKESIQRYDLGMEGSLACIWDSDFVKRSIYFSPQWKALRGYGDNEIGNDRAEWTSRVHPDDAPRVMAAMQAHLDGLTAIYEAEYRTRCKDGSYKWVLDRSKAIRDSTGKVVRNVGSEIDITDRKRTEEALRESENRFEQLAEQSSTVPWEVDPDGLFTYVGHMSEVVYGGYRPDELVGKMSLYDLTPEAERESFKATVFEMIKRRERFVDLENSVKTKDGRVIWVSTNGIPLLNADGTLRGYQGSITDITETKQAKDALQQSEKRYRLLVESAAEAIVVAQDGMLRLVNPMTVAMIGLSEQELLSKPFPSLIHPDDREMVVENYQRRWKDEASPARYTFRLLTKDGSIRWVEISAVVIDWEGRPATLNFLTDITDRKRAEEALKESVQRYELVMDGSSAGLWDWDVVNKRIHFSLRWKAMRGYTDDEIGDSEIEWSLRIHPDDELRVMAAMQAHFMGQTEVYEAEYRTRCKDGSYIWILDRGKAVRDATGKIFRAAGSEIDITDRKRVEEALKKSEELYRLLADNSTDVIGIVDTNGAYTYVSPSVFQLRGYTPEEVLHQTLDQILTKESMLIIKKAIQQNLEKVEQGIIPPTLVREVEQLCKDGSSVWVEAVTNELFDATGKHMGSIVVCRNIAERKRAEDALRLANAKLGILSNVTRHDINNQMMVLSGFLELCRQREKDPLLVPYLDKMSQAAANMQKQIAFAKDYQELGVKAPVWASLGRQTANSFAMLHPSGVVLEDETNGAEVMADPLVEKVPYNLIDNSMRHGGHVTRIKISSRQVGNALLIIYEDDGVGISAEDRKNLFEKGFGKNTGLGLFLMREILAITGITIVENGQAGKGVRFEMLVPSGAWRRAGNGK